MVDTLALGASAARRGGSSPLIRTKRKETMHQFGLFSFGVDLNLYALADCEAICRPCEGRGARARAAACSEHAAAEKGKAR